MYGSLDISTSALVAQRVRLEAIAANIANAESILNDAGEYEPYHRRVVMLGEGDPNAGTEQGVHVSSIAHDAGPLRMKYEPGSPYADADGYVGYPNIDIVVEQMNAMEAQRSYEANITVVEATKTMMSAALQLLA